MQPVYPDLVKCRIYLEGVLFPYAKSVVVSQTEGRVSCQISVPPSIKLKADQWAGMTCHVFYANKRVLESMPDYIPNEWFQKKVSSVKGWPILFQGELAGESHQATVQSENVVLNFVGHSRHFEQTIQYYTDPSKFTFDTQKQAFVFGNARVNIDFDGVQSRTTQLLTTLSKRSAQFSGIGSKGQNIAFTSVVLEILRSIRDQHAIFGHFDNKFRLSQRFGAYADPDVGRVLNLNKISILIDKRAKAMPPHTTVMDVLNMTTGLMRYNWNHIAQPQLRRAAMKALSSADEAEQGNTGDITKTIDEYTAKLIAAFNQDVDTRVISIGNSGEVVFPRNFYADSELISPRVFSNMVFREYEKTGDYGASIQAVVNKKLFPEGLLKGGATLKEVVDEAVEDFRKVEQEENKSQETIELLEYEQAQLENRDELIEFVVTPNLRFAQPPKCNVILPYSFTTVGIQRNHFQEPTRLYGRVPFFPSTSNGQPAIEWYIAPASQAYHHLQGSELSAYHEQYFRFLERNMQRYKADEGQGSVPGEGTEADFN